MATTTIPAATATRMQLFFSAKDLLDADVMSKSDPYVVVYQGDIGSSGRHQQQAMVGRTEIIPNNLNPTWKTAVPVDYHFESRQVFSFIVFDDDNKGPMGDDVLGRGRFELGHVVAGRRATLVVKLAPKGTLVITAQESGASSAGRDTVVLQFGGTSLKKMDWFGKSDPYFKLFRLNPNGTRRLLYQSKPKSKTLDPVWPPTAAIPVAALITGSDTTRPVVDFECWDEDFISDDSMGHFLLSFQDLIEAANSQRSPNPKTFELQHATKKDKTYGRIYVKSANITHLPTFPEFLAAGLQINVGVSIDFTGSNGDPRQPNSLHHMNPNRPNDYMKAIMSVCDVLLEYDSDKMVPVFGFGAQMPDRTVSHYFHANFQPNPEVHGVQGVLDTYGSALQTVRLAGPTNFAPTIRAATQAALASEGTYTILLILTDGAITDTDATIDAIVDAGTAPLSIIIVGVGNADFRTMDVLDGDDSRLKNSYGRPAARDLVQFVPFNRFTNAPPAALAAEVLREVPQQVVEWAAINHVTPAQLNRSGAFPPPQDQQAGHPMPQGSMSV